MCQALEAPGKRLSKQGLAQATVAMDPPEDRSRGNLRTLEPGVQSGAGPRLQPRPARLAPALGAPQDRAGIARSEERRGGKECVSPRRSAWSTVHCKKNCSTHDAHQCPAHIHK